MSTTAQSAKHRWTRIPDGYRTEGASIYDNGGGFGAAKGSGRWAVEMDSTGWLANIDTLAAAKARAEHELRNQR